MSVELPTTPLSSQARPQNRALLAKISLPMKPSPISPLLTISFLIVCSLPFLHFSLLISIPSRVSTHFRPAKSFGQLRQGSVARSRSTGCGQCGAAPPLLKQLITFAMRAYGATNQQTPSKHLRIKDTVSDIRH